MDHQFELKHIMYMDGTVNSLYKEKICKRCKFSYIVNSDGTHVHDMTHILAKHPCDDELVRGIMTS